MIVILLFNVDCSYKLTKTRQAGSLVVNIFICQHVWLVIHQSQFIIILNFSAQHGGLYNCNNKVPLKRHSFVSTRVPESVPIVRKTNSIYGFTIVFFYFKKHILVI